MTYYTFTRRKSLFPMHGYNANTYPFRFCNVSVSTGIDDVYPAGGNAEIFMYNMYQQMHTDKLTFDQTRIHTNPRVSLCYATRIVRCRQSVCFVAVSISPQNRSKPK